MNDHEITSIKNLGPGTNASIGSATAAWPSAYVRDLYDVGGVTGKDASLVTITPGIYVEGTSAFSGMVEPYGSVNIGTSANPWNLGYFKDLYVRSGKIQKLSGTTALPEVTIGGLPRYRTLL
jgi:hypothetical protein